MFVYIASYGPKTVLMTRESHPVRCWLLCECYPMTSEYHQIRQRCITCWVIKQAEFLTNFTIKMLKLKPFFPSFVSDYLFLQHKWALNSADKINTCTGNFIFDGQDMEMLLIEVMTSMCGWLNYLCCSTLPQSRTGHYVNQWASGICSYLNQCLVLFWTHGLESLKVWW